MATKPEEPAVKSAPKAQEAEKKARKDVPGNFSYSFTPGRFKEALQAMIGAERPPSFNRDFIETVLNIKGGSVSGFPPILKRLGFLGSDNSPTELYGLFQGDSSRSAAAFTGLKNGFAELFKRNAHVHKADDAKIKDYLVQIPPRSKNPIDYLTFGHLGEIIKFNWDIFAGLFPNCEVERLERVISRLNIARGPIAHCGYLPEDEVVRLKLAIRDWYALAE